MQSTSTFPKPWGPDGSLWLLLIAAASVSLIMLSGNELWTMESRWAAVTLQMILRNDYLHPFIYNGPYYDKPLLSYWLILACAKAIGNLNEWALRLPSALASIIAVYCTYSIGQTLINRSTGLMAGWLLITLFFFDTWGRIASADMLNVAGITLAILWYIKHKDDPHFFNYLIFFIITAITCLCKGLAGIVLPLLAVAPDLFSQQGWKKHRHFSLLIAGLCGVIIYLLPFFMSAYFGDQTLKSSGLIEVFQENVKRFISPFDHAASFYAYFTYLPVYLLPWLVFFIPALFYNLWKWKELHANQRYLTQVAILFLLFFSLSGSKRGYYILPMLPFAVLVTADWLNNFLFFYHNNWSIRLQYVVYVIFIAILLWFGTVQPFYNQRDSGIWQFAEQVQKAQKIANSNQAWNDWEITVLNSAADSSAIFYLQPQHPVNAVDLHAIDRAKIIIAAKKDLHKIQPILSNYYVIVENKNSPEAAVALIPKKQ
jgi:4-amino-4-deoxy-L-arabinose transferase-like glycosyltransferase